MRDTDVSIVYIVHPNGSCLFFFFFFLLRTCCVRWIVTSQWHPTPGVAGCLSWEKRA